MRLINTQTLKLHEFFDAKVPQYAILSHRWEGKEITLQEYERQPRPKCDGLTKIEKFCSFALSQHYAWAWVDTCCIDKKSSAELSEAINSMFKWYRKAAICYAYLSDVKLTRLDVGVDRQVEQKLDPPLAKSLWFTRGWTLQELLAPKPLVFLDRQWQVIATKAKSASILAKITGISSNIIENGFSPGRVSVATIFSWMSGRFTTRIEDRSYCLLGLLDINMPLLYGEGENAFFRLQKTFMEKSNDMSLFLWEDMGWYFKPRKGKPLMAPHVGLFKNYDGYCTEDMIDEYWDDPQIDTHLHILVQSLRTSYTVTNRGLEIQALVLPETGVPDVPQPQPGSRLMLTNVISVPQPTDLHDQNPPLIMAINITRRWTGLSAIRGARPMYFKQAVMEKINAWIIDENLDKLEVIDICLEL